MNKKSWYDCLGAFLVFLIVIVCATLTNPGRASQKIPNELSTVRKVITQELPDMNGGHLQVTLVEVNFAPSASSAPHSHPCPVIAYVEQGVVESKVKGQPERTYRMGETFYEPPNGVHEISRNVSATEPAKLLAMLVCDKEGPLSTPVRGEK
ncbi:MAG: cupin domain-containing protein [Candidatus Acidiferrales bacterium]|jgi:quercetin dioxygenase-like cupin family protein